MVDFHSSRREPAFALPGVWGIAQSRTIYCSTGGFLDHAGIMSSNLLSEWLQILRETFFSFCLELKPKQTSSLVFCCV